MYFSGQDGRSGNRDKPAACPKCGGTTILPIRYGMPGPEPETDERSAFASGGCVIDERSRKWECDACRATFNDGGADLLEPIDYRPQWVRDFQE